MLRMATGMKDYAVGFKEQFALDDEVIKKIDKSMDSNLQKTEKQTKILKIEQSYAFSGIFKKMLMLAVALGVFVFMFMFIRMFPNKRYYNYWNK